VRVLIVSYFFPPFNSMGAIRVGKMAKYLALFGHDVRVVTARDQPLQQTVPVELEEERIERTSWINVNRPAEMAMGGRARIAAQGYSAGGRAGRGLKGLGAIYKRATNIPDGEVGWAPFALSAASRLIADWKPDVLYASAKPYTSLLVAHVLARRHQIPWIAELRDLWTDNPYTPYTPWRKKLDGRLERRILSSAAGLVTVSEPLGETLRTKYGKPTAVVLNGFDADDHPKPQSTGPVAGPMLRVVYTGMVYAGKRDPTPLFLALRSMGDAATQVRVVFYGRYLDAVRDLARNHDVEHLVEVNEPIAYGEALQAQAEADVLLLLLWNSLQEKGIYTGKVFEYFGARRPILVIGPEDNVAAALITQRGAGVALNVPEAIAEQLRHWIQLKTERGALPPLPEEALLGLSREEQARSLERFLYQLVPAES
jgi:hypothetical protein